MKNNSRNASAMAMKNRDDVHYKPREVITLYCESTPYTVSKDKWNTKEDTDKSNKNGLYIMWYAKRARYVSG